MSKAITLTPNEIELRIRFDNVRKNYSKKDGTYVFVKCDYCKGTGLILSGEMWDCSSYCAKCKGFGGEFVLKEMVIECDKCRELEDKKGCDKCKGTGYLDWLENIIGKRKDE
jgi:DnaJ-class molecular chaperone